MRANNRPTPALSALMPWYTAQLRPLLCAHAAHLVADLDERITAVAAPAPRPREVRAGVIGEAGVGKSMLINALLSARLPILPQGGTGPLTATPIEVRYAADPFVRVGCRGRECISELMEAVATNSLPPYRGVLPRDRLQPLRQLALLLVTGSQFADIHPTVLLGALASCLSGELGERVPRALHQRVLAARSAMACGDSPDPYIVISAGADLPALIEVIAQHGAGSLAPLTRSIELGWDAETLREGLVLVDLPGLGVANDQYRATTCAAIGHLDVVLCVVDSSGLTQSSADLLQSTGVLRRMLDNASRGERPLPELLIAVTKLDEPVGEDMLASEQPDKKRLSWAEARLSAANRARELVRKQLALELGRLATSADEVALARVKRRIAVQPVFPREYQRLHRHDPDEPTPLERDADSGIPALCFHLKRLVRAHASDALRACERALEHLELGPGQLHAARCRTELLELQTLEAMIARGPASRP